VLASAAYLLALLANNTGLGVSGWVPPVPRYFTQAACLFPDAATVSIEYRVEGWSCTEKRWLELDHRRDFPMHAENKESRFHRLGHFYRSNLPVMQALDAYLVGQHNARVERGEEAGSRIGGIQFVSLRIPLPVPGTAVERYRWRPLSDYPGSYQKREFKTGAIRRRDRCGEPAK
jgi:hypothetical protein